MARGSTLVRVLDLYRAEVRASQNPAHNSQVRDTQVKLLQRTQEQLWEDFDWPLLRVFRYVELQTGQRRYSPPSDMKIDRINKVEVFHDSAWCPLHAGIDAENYTAYNSDLDERQWPPQRYQYDEDEQLEIWPIPDAGYDAASKEGWVRLTGIRNLKPFVADGDRADIDDRLIALYAAAETLAADGAKDAQLKLDLANKRFAKLRGAQMPRRKFKLFGAGQSDRPRRVPIAVYNKTS